MNSKIKYQCTIKYNTHGESMNNINTNKFKKVLDDDPDIIIKTYLQDEDASILILRSGDLGDEDYRVSLEKQSIDEDDEEPDFAPKHGYWGPYIY